MAKKLGPIANAFYIILCVLSIGTIWMTKVIIQKAVIDANK